MVDNIHGPPAAVNHDIALSSSPYGKAKESRRWKKPCKNVRGSYLELWLVRESGVVKVPEFGEQVIKDIVLRPESGPESEPESGLESIRHRVLTALQAEPLSKSELAAILGHKGISGRLNQRIRQMLADGFIEYTLPDKPNSRLQKYRLSTKGRAWLEAQ